MRVSRTCGVPCTRHACGHAAADCLLLQEQLAFVTDHLALLCAHHQQVCQQQQERLTEATARAVRSRAWVGTVTQIRTQSRRHSAVWEDIHGWAEQARAQLRHIRSSVGAATPRIRRGGTTTE